MVFITVYLQVGKMCERRRYMAGTTADWQKTNGVYIHFKDNSAIPYSSDLVLTQEQKDFSDGVALTTDNCSFVIGRFYLPWGNASGKQPPFGYYNEPFPNYITTTDSARLDYAGKANTKAFLELGNEGVPYWCSQQLFLDGTDKEENRGYCGSVGEHVEWYNNQDEVYNAFKLIEGDNAMSIERTWNRKIGGGIKWCNSYYTSSNYNDTNIWVYQMYNGGNIQNKPKNIIDPVVNEYGSSTRGVYCCRAFWCPGSLNSDGTFSLGGVNN